jgi:hypothetical protein
MESTKKWLESFLTELGFEPYIEIEEFSELVNNDEVRVLKDSNN